MRLLPDAVLHSRYDVIVVGAGLGGMAAASLLAKRGLSVLMIDQQHKPGGSCTSFKREGIVYDVGTAMIYGFGDKGFKPFRFLMNELEEPIDIVAHPTLARMTVEGRPIVFWPDVDRFLGELGDLFPGERDALRAFYADLYRMYENIVIKNEVVVPPSEFSARQGLRSLMSSPITMLKMQKLLSTSVQDLLDRYFHSEEVVDFFDKLCSAYCYCTAAETPAVLAATMFLDNHIGGVYYPAGGAQNLPNKIEMAFERYGGQALYSHKVDEILLQGNRACGVRLEGGLEILADRVVANATVWNIYGKLIRPEHIPPERLAWARSLVPTFPSMTLYMLVDADAFPADAMPWEIFIENREVIDSSDLTLYVNSLVDRTLCPPGTQVVMAIAPNLCSWPAPQDPAYGMAEYRAQKEREAERMLEQIEHHYPGFRRHIRTLIVGTPTTIERYLLKNGGAVGGPKNMIGQEMLKRLHARSEWKNLYFCGDSTVMATGAPATAVSGVGAANMVLRDLHRKEYDTHRFPRQYVRFVDLPYQPAADPGSELPAAAAQCQWCEVPACVPGCPAGNDIPGFLRRIEAGNMAGAARLLRATNPFAETCGHVCSAAGLCEKSCFRKDFAKTAVRIAELERRVCREAGDEGWPRPERRAGGPRCAVIGDGPAGLTCAYYLGLLGFGVDLYGPGPEPGAAFLAALGPGEAQQAAQRDLQGILAVGIRFHAAGGAGAAPDVTEMLKTYAAVCLDLPETAGADLRAAAGQSGVYACRIATSAPLVEAVAAGRRMAAAAHGNS